jgi:hypothetical protein
VNDKLLNQFDQEVEVDYRDETYLVRDNGAVFRKARPGKRKRKLDQIWTFGNPSNSNGYMTIGSVTVHRIVATAFHGQQPSEKHIVDHIDTNRRNNRADNLRWITRLENILFNPITLRRIEFAYGSVDELLKNPDKPLHAKLANNFGWMRAVSKEEAKASWERITRWVVSGKEPRGDGLGEWIFTQTSENEKDRAVTKQSLTPMALQRNWHTLTEFQRCPVLIGEDPLQDYLSDLDKGCMFASNQYAQSVVEEACLNENEASLSVICHLEGSAKPWAVTLITIVGEQFCHQNMGSFFSYEGANKQHYENLGRDWRGVIGDCIDDYC